MLCYVMLCYVMLCYVMLCYVMLCYVMLCYVMLCYVMLCYVMLCYVMLCYVMLCYVMLCYVMLCYVMLCYVMLCYVMLCYVMLCYVMLCYVMLCYVTESCPSGPADNEERHCIKDHTSKVTQHLLVSCSRVTFNNAVKYCHSIGGQILRNHSHLETTFKKFPPQSFYNCKKFWLCCNGLSTFIT